MGKHGAATGYAMVFVAALMWGSIGLFVKGISATGVSSQTMAAFRLLAGAVLLAPTLAIMGCRGSTNSTAISGPLALFKVSPRSLVPCALVGIVGLAISNACYYECISEVGLSTASVLLYTSPVFGCMLGRILYAERVAPRKLVAIAFNIVGCALAVTNGDLTGFHFSVKGIALGVIAGLCGALLAVFSRIATSRMHPLSVTFWGFVFGGVFMGVLSAPWQDLALALSPTLIALFAGFGLIPTALAYTFYMQGLSKGLETSKVPVIASVETVVTVLMGIGFYAEPTGAAKVLGILLVLGSIVIMNADISHMRQSAFADHVAESFGFIPNQWWGAKADEMDALFEPWYFVR